MKARRAYLQQLTSACNGRRTLSQSKVGRGGGSELEGDEGCNQQEDNRGLHLDLDTLVCEAKVDVSSMDRRY
jgi:hypothetical protein